MQMGVRSEISLYSTSEQAARSAAVLAFDEINRLEEIFSDYRPRSELSRLSDRAGIPDMGTQVSPELAEILRASLVISRVSDGAFDATIGAATKLWRESRRSGVLPERLALEAARSTVGWQSLSIDHAGRVVLSRQGTRLDLGGIAKGYAAQRAADLLIKSGATRCMVALAGDVVVGDPPPGKPGWRIAIGSGRENPTDGVAGIEILLTRAAVSTSGDAAQWVEIDGVRYAHILDPRTGLGSTRQRSATVVARSQGGMSGGMSGGISGGTRADALSTACYLTCEDADAFARAFSVAVYIIDAGGVRSSDPLGVVVGR